MSPIVAAQPGKSRLSVLLERLPRSVTHAMVGVSFIRWRRFCSWSFAARSRIVTTTMISRVGANRIFISFAVI